MLRALGKTRSIFKITNKSIKSIYILIPYAVALKEIVKYTLTNRETQCKADWSALISLVQA